MTTATDTWDDLLRARGATNSDLRLAAKRRAYERHQAIGHDEKAVRSLTGGLVHVVAHRSRFTLCDLNIALWLLHERVPADTITKSDRCPECWKARRTLTAKRGGAVSVPGAGGSDDQDRLIRVLRRHQWSAAVGGCVSDVPGEPLDDGCWWHGGDRQDEQALHAAHVAAVLIAEGFGSSTTHRTIRQTASKAKTEP